MTQPEPKFSATHHSDLRARWALVAGPGQFLLAVTGDNGQGADLRLSEEEFYELREAIDDLYWETHPSTRQEPSTD